MQESRPFDRAGIWIEAVGAWWVAVVAAWTIIVCLIPYSALPGIVSVELYMYLIQPFLWSLLAFLSFLGWKYGLQERPAFSKPLISLAILFGACQVALFIIAGLFYGFGRSPYDHRFLAIMGNLLYTGTMLVGMEMSRAYLAAFVGKRRPLLALVLVCLFFSLLSIPLAKFVRFQRPLSALQVTGQTLLPTLSENLLATLLALLGGPTASLAYRCMPMVFEWLSPILPNLKWIATAFLGTTVPAIGVLFFYQRFAVQPTSGEDTQPQQKQSLTPWVVVAMIAVLLFGFNSGIFGVSPTLVASNSMSPTLHVGDVVVARDVSAEAIEVGDIIRFQQGGIYIIHRVVEIQPDSSQLTFITRGDANNANDPPVAASQLTGKVVFTIPKIGWVTIVIREVIDGIR